MQNEVSAAAATAITAFFGWLTFHQRLLYRALRERVDAAEARNQALSQAVDQLQVQLRTLILERDSLRHELDERREEHAALRAEWEALEADWRLATEHIADLQEQVRALGQEPTPSPVRDTRGRFAKRKKPRPKSKINLEEAQ